MYSVVVIDDSRIAVDAVIQSTDWETCHCEVIGYALNGIAALQLIREEQPDIAIIDIQMPGMSGLDVIRQLHDEESTRFIIISGYSQFEYARSAIRYGVRDYLLKPIMKEEMESALQRVTTELDRNQAHSDVDILVQEDSLTAQLRHIRGAEDQYSTMVMRALAWVDDRVNTNITLSDICKDLKVSTGHFSKCFKRETGIGFSTYVNMVKMDKARELLQDPRNRVGEVASSLGYSDYAYFFQVFKKQFGYAPSDIKSGGKK